MIMVQGYKVKEKIYESANTEVYRAVRELDNLPIILKVLKQAYPPPEKIAWFRREYEVTRSLKLPGVVDAYALISEQNQWIMVLEDFGGESLAQLKVAGKLPLDGFLRLAIKLTDLLGQIHEQNIIHKDVNPSNIIYNLRTGQLKMIDFGISTVLSRETQTFRNPNVLEGTLAYMSPEQTGRMNRVVDYRTDFYSLGVTFYELLTGQLPFAVRDALELVHAHTAKQAVSPHEIKPEVPQIVSDIVMKLISKDAEDRYQSAYGLKVDLERCLKEWQEKSGIEHFKLGERDISERFRIPQKLYGREVEVSILLGAFDRVSEGASEMMLVTGYAGIGKTALIQEVYKPITQKRGYFISGKFDQVQRNIPYTALIQAFQSLIRQILTESEDQIKIWRWKLLDALGDNGQVIIEVIPDVELIMGKQPSMPQLPPAETQNRFTLFFQKFIQVFMRAEHPLVMFLDDLQWADAASLNLLKTLMTAPDSRYLFFIGAYRDMEVNSGHPLVLSLKELQEAGVVTNYISLLPLGLLEVSQFVADTVNSRLEQVRSLAELILKKTGGNPFFIIEFLKSLRDENLLKFDRQSGIWHWDLELVKGHRITDNVVELMAEKAKKLSLKTQEILKLAACIGNHFDLHTLAVIYERTYQETASDLWEAIKEDLVLPLSDTYKLAELDVKGLEDKLNVEYRFVHDRIRQAVYSLIVETDKQTLHLRVGRLLLQNTPTEKREEKIFDVVNQLNLGSSLITSQSQRDELAELNLTAGRKAIASAAYGAAFKYLQIGLNLLAVDSWVNQYDITLTLHVQTAEAAYLSGNFEQMERLAKVVLKRAKNLLDKVKVYEIQIMASIAQQKLLEAVQIALPVLKMLGVKFPKDAGPLRILVAFLKTKFILAGKQMEDLADLPEMTDPYKLAAVRILSKVASAIYIVVPRLFPLLVFKGINLLVKYGNSTLSPFVYSGYGLILCGVIGDIDSGYRFGNLALNLLDRLNLKKEEAKTFFVVNELVRHWKEHINATLKPSLEGYQSGLATGDFEFAGLCAAIYFYHAYLIGNELIGLEQEMASLDKSIRQLKQGRALHVCRIFWQSALNLLSRSEDPCQLIGEVYNEGQSLPLLLEANDRTTICHLYISKLILCYLFRQRQQAIENTNMVKKYLDSLVSTLNVPLFHFYESLAHLAIFSDVADKEKKRILKKVKANQKKMKKWAHHAPMNHLHKFYLVEAEYCRVLKREGEAVLYYSKGISLARENEYLNEEALANELAARFYFGIGVETVGKAYLLEAHYAYLRWGAKAKVKALEKEFPQWLAKAEKSPPVETTTTTPSTGTRGEILDLSAVMKASQAISGEIHLDKLLDQLMKIVIENAGAQMGYLILEEQGKLLIEAEGAVDKEEIAVIQSKAVDEEILPMSIINYVARSKESVILNNASEEGDFTQDTYIKAKQSRSILCAPLLYQNELRGIVYLENNLTTGAFTTERLQMLQMLSAQAAVSIENAIAYKTLEGKVEERTKELQTKMKDLTEFHDLAVGRELKMMEMENKIRELEAKLGMK